MAGEKGTGRHSRKSGSKQQASNETRDLKEREYRDKEGNIHHHTRTSREMQARKAS